MNIQAKVQEIREAVHNLNGITEGLKGLRETIVPDERIDTRVTETCVPLLESFETKFNHYLIDANNALVEVSRACEQTAGEAVQRAETLTHHVSAELIQVTERIASLEDQLADLQETLDTLAQAATRKKRNKA